MSKDFRTAEARPGVMLLVISILMTGLTVGILVSRTISGIIAEHYGWRAVYLFAAVLAVLFGILLMKYLPKMIPKKSTG